MPQGSPDAVSITPLLCGGPFAVVLQAVNPAGSLLANGFSDGWRSIGRCRSVAARLHGAREIVATDVMAAVPWKRRLGSVPIADVTFADAADQLGAYACHKGYFEFRFRIFRNEHGGSLGARVLNAARRPGSARSRRGFSSRRTWCGPRKSEMRGTFRSTRKFGLGRRPHQPKRVDLTPLLDLRPLD